MHLNLSMLGTYWQAGYQTKQTAWIYLYLVFYLRRNYNLLHYVWCFHGIQYWRYSVKLPDYNKIVSEIVESQLLGGNALIGELASSMSNWVLCFGT